MVHHTKPLHFIQVFKICSLLYKILVFKKEKYLLNALKWTVFSTPISEQYRANEITDKTMPQRKIQSYIKVKRDSIRPYLKLDLVQDRVFRFVNGGIHKQLAHPFLYDQITKTARVKGNSS